MLTSRKRKRRAGDGPSRSLAGGDVHRYEQFERERADAILGLFLAPPGDEPALLTLAINQAVRLTRSRSGVLVELADESTVTRATWSNQVPERCRIQDGSSSRVVAHSSIWSRCIRKRGALILNRFDADAHRWPEGHLPLRRVLCAPIFDEGRVAAICMVEGKPRGYDRSDAEGLMLFVEALWAIVVRRRLETALSEREEMFRALAEQSVAGAGLITPAGLEYANRALENLAGWTLAEVQAKGPLGFAECIHPDDREMVMQRHVARMSGTPGLPDTYEFRLLRPDGTVRWVTLSASRLQVHGNPAIALTMVDSHERHLAVQVQQEAMRRVRDAMHATIEAIGRTVEVRDSYTAGHQRRAADLSRAIGAELGLDSDRLEAIRIAALLHDVGKVGVPAEILARPGRLPDFEMDLVRQHVRIGYEILAPIRFPWPIATFVAQHHERLDGSGYPQGLTAPDLPLESRILAVADVVEAMVSHRPYRAALGLDAALHTIRSEAGTRLDADVVEVCERLFQQKGYRLPEPG